MICEVEASQSIDAPAAVCVTLRNQDSSLELCKLGSVRDNAGLYMEPCLFQTKTFQIHSLKRSLSAPVMSEWPTMKPVKTKLTHTNVGQSIQVQNLATSYLTFLTYRIHTVKFHRCCGEPILRARSTGPEGKRRCFRSLKGEVKELPAPANSHPTWPVRCSHVAWMYDSPEAAAVTGISTPSCIYDSIKTRHKDKVVVRANAPFILRRILSPSSH